MLNNTDVAEMDCPLSSAPKTWARMVKRPVSSPVTESNILPHTLRELARQDFSVSPDTRAAAVAKTFDEAPELPGVLVCEEGDLLGLISRSQFQEQLSHPFGVELYLKRPIRDLIKHMTSETCVLPASCEISKATEFALLRPVRAIYEPLVVDDDGAFTLLDVHGLLLAQTKLLSEANEIIQQQKDLAEAANDAKSRFLANMSHEIRTPLTAILGFAENLLEPQEDLERRWAAETILRNGEHLLRVINDILDLSKIEAGRLDVELLSVSPTSLVADVLATLKPRADAKELPLRLTYSSLMPNQVLTDPTRLRQILINLLGNAIKFTSTGFVELQVECHRERSHHEPSELRFTILDTGIGLTPEQIEKLFQPFMQADNSTTRRFGGTGLGLTISRRLAQLLGGDVTVTSELNRGSHFTLTVQAGSLAVTSWSDPRRMSLSSSRATSVLAASEAVRLSGRILLAEDSLDNQQLISTVLRRAGATVTLAQNGEEAVTIAWTEFRRNQPFDVVLMDMQMPVLDGYSATEKLRTMGYREPIIALTANAMRGDRQLCLDAGCDDYAVKPIERANLLRTIAKHMRGAACQSAEAQEADANHSPEDRRLNACSTNSIEPQARFPDGPGESREMTAIEGHTLGESSCSTVPLPALRRETRDLAAAPAARLAPLESLAAGSSHVMPGFHQALENMEGDEQLYLEIALLVADDLKQSLANLDTAMSGQQFQVVQRIAHTLKSAADNIGATPCRQAANTVEQLARTDRWEELPAAVAQLQLQATVLSVTLSQYLSNSS